MIKFIPITGSRKEGSYTLWYVFLSHFPNHQMRPVGVVWLAVLLHVCAAWTFRRPTNQWLNSEVRRINIVARGGVRNGGSGIGPPSLPPLPVLENVTNSHQNSTLSSFIFARTWINNDIAPLVAFVCLSLTVRTFVLEPLFVPSSSMFPTFAAGDYIIVNKIEWLMRGLLRRQDVVVFNPPRECQSLLAPEFHDTLMVKRVVGLSGDTVEIRNDQLLVNGIVQPEPYLARDSQGTPTIGYDMARIVIPKNMLFVLGDNRNNSLDSHIWGCVPRNNVVGRVVCRYWPPSRVALIRRTHL